MKRLDNLKEVVILNKVWPLNAKLELKVLDSGCWFQAKIDESLPSDFMLNVLGFMKGIYADDSEQKYACLSMEIDGDPLFFCLLDKIIECHELDHVKREERKDREEPPEGVHITGTPWALPGIGGKKR